MQVRPLIKATQLSNRNTALIIIAMMLFLVVLMIVLANAAFVQNDELLENGDFDDFIALEGWLGIWTTFTSLLLLSCLNSKLHVLAIAVEYLKSHIGEKRFSDSIAVLDNLFPITDSIMTVLFNHKAVICFLSLACTLLIYIKRRIVH